MCTINMTFEVPDSRAIDIEALKSQLNDLFKVIVSRPSLLKKETPRKSSLRTAFSGDWNNTQDSVSYAQMLREECVTFKIGLPKWTL